PCPPLHRASFPPRRSSDLHQAPAGLALEPFPQRLGMPAGLPEDLAVPLGAQDRPGQQRAQSPDPALAVPFGQRAGDPGCLVQAVHPRTPAGTAAVTAAPLPRSSRSRAGALGTLDAISTR